MSECTGATRFPPLTPENNNLDATGLETYNYLVAGTEATYGDVIITKDADGALQGPFNFLLYNTTIAEPWINLQVAVAKLLVASEAEAAVLGVLSVTKATYGVYAHTLLAEKAGYTAAQVQSMLAGKCPVDVTARQAAVWTLAAKLALARGVLDTASFNEAKSVLGISGVTGVIHQTSAFMYASIILNAGDVCLPAGVGC